jgi:hypothetical protein
VIYSEEKLKKVTDTLDDDPKNNIMMLYVHSMKNPGNINTYIFKKILNNVDLSMFINNNLQFYPALENAKSLSLFKNFFAKPDVPCFLFFRWGLENKLKLLRMVNLRSRPNPDQIFEIMTDVIELANEQSKNEQSILDNIKNKSQKRKDLELEHVKRINQFYDRQERMQNNQNNR